jgi:hypothetical protein
VDTLLSIVTEQLGNSQLAFSHRDEVLDEGLQKLESRGESPLPDIDSLYSKRSISRARTFRLASQMRRSRASIGANIVEGRRKRGNNEFHRYPQIGSCSERTSCCS